MTLTERQAQASAECAQEAQDASDAVVASPALVAVVADWQGVHDETVHDPRWTALNDEWHQCVTRHGASGSPESPEDMQKDITNDLQRLGAGVVLEERQPSAEEIAEAESLAQKEQTWWDSDRSCRKEVRLLPRRDDLIAAHQVDWLKSHRDLVERITAEINDFNRSH